MSSMSPLSVPQFRSVTRLLQKKFRRETGRTLLEGKRLVREALESPDTVVFALMTHAFAGSEEGGTLADLFAHREIPVHAVSQKQIERLTDTVTPQGVLAVIRAPQYDEETVLSAVGPGTLLVALDGISDPGNIGTIVRTCAWFGADGVLLNDTSVEIANPKVLRATMGAIFHIPVVEKVDLSSMIRRLKSTGFRIVVTCADAGTATVPEAGEGKTLVIFGGEAHGISEGLKSAADVKLKIPRYGAGESLNVSVAAGIILHMMRSRSG